jgi:hypothetical protein
MANDGIQNLDLAQILQTLANLPKAHNAPAQIQQQPYDPTQVQAPAESHSQTYFPTQTGIPYGHQQSGALGLIGRTPTPISQQQIPQNRASTPMIDPATITEWKHGLRCVNKLAAQNPNFAGAIQKLMKDQERNVKDWESGRQRLIEDQEVKRENERTHRAALSLPGLLENTEPLRTPAREKDELNQYNQKVYRACRLMAESHSTQLKGLGVPFFGVRPELILPEGVEPVEEDPGMSQKITRTQMLELQRRMLSLLTDLYGD